MPIFAIEIQKLRHKSYTLRDLTLNIVSEVYKFEAVTLDTNYKWWAPGAISPYIGYVLNVSHGYTGCFSTEELLHCLKDQGLLISEVPYFSGIYYITRY